jgi:penicillin-binding protein activator
MAKYTIIFIITALLLMSCGSSRKVTRLDEKQITDLSGRWNDTDSKLTAAAMVDDLIKRPWVDNFIKKAGKEPVVIVGNIRNKSSEHIATDIFIKDIERELLNTGKVKFVATADEREQLRLERIDQQTFSSDESMKKLANETGADFMLIGVINSVFDTNEGTRAKFYQVNLEMIELESNTKVWIGDKQIKKLVEQDSYKW